MYIHLLSLFVCVIQILGKCPDDCNHSNFLYESFQCTPSCVDDDECPISYNCSAINQHNDMCFYNGNHYAKGESVENSLTWEHCMGCSCEETTDNTTSFICYSADCTPPIESDDGCISKHALGQCCVTGIICPPYSKCILDGKEFQEDHGKFLHPKDNCTKCTCERGNGTQGVVKCQKQYCRDLLQHQTDVKRMCAPFYNDLYDNCCPSQWICPEDNVTFDEEPLGDDGPSCLFGNKTIKINQKFYSNQEKGKIVCECILPPFARCSLMTDN